MAERPPQLSVWLVRRARRRPDPGLHFEQAGAIRAWALLHNRPVLAAVLALSWRRTP